jgi:hypothetical protein
MKSLLLEFWELLLLLLLLTPSRPKWRLAA